MGISHTVLPAAIANHSSFYHLLIGKVGGALGGLQGKLDGALGDIQGKEIGWDERGYHILFYLTCCYH